VSVFLVGDRISAFPLSASTVSIQYASGKCVEDHDYDFISADDWAVPAGVIAEIEIPPWDGVELRDLGIDTTNFQRKKPYRAYDQWHVLYDKDLGIAIEVYNDTGVHSIHLFPSRANLSRLCKNPKLRRFYLSNDWRRRPEKKTMMVDSNHTVHVADVQITPLNGEGPKFQVDTTAQDPDNDVLTYNYVVSGGKIVGVGARVVWDLSGSALGTYKITVGVDDGCGICGRILSKVITIK